MDSAELYHRTPDDIVQEIEAASDALYKVEWDYAQAEANFKSLEAGLFVGLRDGGRAVGECEKRARSSNEWVKVYTHVQELNVAVQRAKRDYNLALIKGELWRSEQANRRRI